MEPEAPAVPIFMVIVTLPLPASMMLLLLKTAMPARRSIAVAPGSLALKLMLPLSEITLALTKMLRPARKESDPPVLVPVVTIELLIVRSLFASRTTEPPPLVAAVITVGEMRLLVEGFVANAASLDKGSDPVLMTVMFS